MAVDCFIKIDDLKGECVVDGFQDQIQCLSWTWGMSQSGTTHRGTGGGAGKSDVQDLAFSHYVDSASPSLQLACLNGKHFEEAILTCRKAGENPLEYLTITMKDLICTSVQTTSSPGSEQIEEMVSLNFANVCVSYQPQDNKGAKAGGSIDIEYSVAENK